MISITGLGGAAPAGRSTTRAAGGKPDFTVAEAEAAAPGLVSATAGLDALGGMLVLQEAAADGRRDREARRHGQELLAELALLQRELLAGTDDPAPLARLAQLADGLPMAADPALRAVVQAVGLRAKVELARRGFSGS